MPSSDNQFEQADYKLLDYSNVFYELLNDEPVPPVRGGKFILLSQASITWLVMSPIELSKFHANIIERFIESKGYPGHYVSNGERYLIDDPSWQIEGGGKFSIDDERMTLTLHGKSLVYGPASKLLLERFAQVINDTQGHSVTIND